MITTTYLNENLFSFFQTFFKWMFKQSCWREMRSWLEQNSVKFELIWKCGIQLELCENQSEVGIQWIQWRESVETEWVSDNEIYNIDNLVFREYINCWNWENLLHICTPCNGDSLRLYVILYAVVANYFRYYLKLRVHVTVSSSLIFCLTN